jgi:AcrR family transcriptional regulator
VAQPQDAEVLLGPLPPGRHRLARDVVVASQRARLLAAMTGTMADRPYGETTVADVVARAGVSRRTFYEHFASKMECFLAAYDAGTEMLIRAIAAAVSGRQGWRSRLRAGVEAYLEALASSPGFTRLFVLEIVGAGDAALERRGRVHRRFVGLYRELNATARAEDPAVRSVADEELLLVVAGTEQLVAEHVQRGDVHQLPGLAPAIVSVVSSLLLAS